MAQTHLTLKQGQGSIIIWATYVENFLTDPIIIWTTHIYTRLALNRVQGQAL